MTARETVAAKAMRYLTEGRLTVTCRVGDLVEAECEGSDGNVYTLGHYPDRPGHWPCSCPAPRGCAHVVALMTVIIRRREVPEAHPEAVSERTRKHPSKAHLEGPTK